MESRKRKNKTRYSKAIKGPIADELRRISMTKFASSLVSYLNPNVSTMILGASKIEQLEENLSSTG